MSNTEEVIDLSKSYPSLEGTDKALVEGFISSSNHLVALAKIMDPLQEYFSKKYCHACDYYGDEDNRFLCIRQDIQCPLKIMGDIVDEIS